VGNLTLGQKAMFAPTTIIGPLAVLAGAITASALGGRFVLRAASGAQLGRSLVGGATMGFATILVPGGNDTLLLSALPSLAAHGAVAYLAMFGVQLSLSMVAGRWKNRNMRRGKRGTTGRSEASGLEQAWTPVATRRLKKLLQQPGHGSRPYLRMTCHEGAATFSSTCEV
jgi:sulfur transporter